MFCELHIFLIMIWLGNSILERKGFIILCNGGWVGGLISSKKNFCRLNCHVILSSIIVVLEFNRIFGIAYNV
jgi:hypothetical protein